MPRRRLQPLMPQRRSLRRRSPLPPAQRRRPRPAAVIFPLPLNHAFDFQLFLRAPQGLLAAGSTASQLTPAPLRNSTIHFLSGFHSQRPLAARCPCGSPTRRLLARNWTQTAKAYVITPPTGGNSEAECRTHVLRIASPTATTDDAVGASSRTARICYSIR